MSTSTSAGCDCSDRKVRIREKLQGAQSWPGCTVAETRLRGSSVRRYSSDERHQASGEEGPCEFN
jgi:hypothetical protein